MVIAIVGLTDKLRSEIFATCKNRGMEILPEKDARNLKAEDIRRADAVIDATDPAQLAEAEREIWQAGREHLLAVLKEFPDVRYIRIGESGADCGTEFLQEEGCSWTCFCPPEQFLPEGENCGMYIPASGFQIRNSVGENAISYSDFALALADELEKPHFIRKTFTAVSDTSRLQMQKTYNLLDIFNGSGTTFQTKGSYFGIFPDFTGRKRPGMTYQGSKIMIISRRTMLGAMMPGAKPGSGDDLLYLYPTWQGKRIGFATRFAPTELSLVTARGTIRICFADDRLMYIKGEKGLGLQFEKALSREDLIKKRGEKAWEAIYRFRCSLLLNPLEGDMKILAPWNGKTASTPFISGTLTPDEKGEFLLAVEESVFAAKLRDSYPSYEEALSATTADWEAFLSKIPHFTEELEICRIEAAWHEWSSIVSPSGLIRHTEILMTQSMLATSWQMVQNAVGLHHDFSLATDLLVNMIDGIAESGQLPDFIFDGQIVRQSIHPPVQGWALKWLMRLHDFKKEMPEEMLMYLYEGYGRMADWFMKYRDDDKDGLPQIEDGIESGYDDISVFVHEVCVEGPDFAACLGALFDALGDIALLLGRQEEAGTWHARADEIIDKLVKNLWNGEKFIALTNDTHEVVNSNAITDYLPLLLGDRLPQEIIDKMTKDLLVEGDFLSPVGLTTEKISSDQFRRAGFSRGLILPQNNLMILTGMYMAGKKEEAKMIARRYCEGMITCGIAMLMDPIEKDTKTTFSCTWPACAFLALADMAYGD